MSNEPVLKAIPDDAPADAAPSGDARLRAEIATILGTIAQAKAALEDARRHHDEAETLLRDTESRAQLVLGLIAPAADAEPPVADAEPPAPVDEAHLRSVEEQAFLDALGLYDTVEVAADQRQASQAPEAHERVPTVSGVVSQLGRGGMESGALQGDETNAVRMLEAMVEELAAAMPVEPRAQSEQFEPAPLPAAEAESVAEPALTASTQQNDQQPPEEEQTTSAEPQAEIPEPAAQAIASEEIAPPDETPPPPETTELAAEAPVDEPLAESEQEAMQELPGGPLEQPVEAADSDFAPQSDEATATTASDETQAAPDEPVVAVAQPESAQDEPTAAREPLIPENELLTSFAQMATRPFLPPEIGTAVIFGPTHAASAAAQRDSTVEAESPGEVEAAEEQARGSLATAELPAPEASSPPTVPPDIATETATAAAEPSAEPIEPTGAEPEPPSDTDLDALLFGTSGGSEPDTDVEQIASPPWPLPAAAVSDSPEAGILQPETARAAWAVDLPVPANARAAPVRVADPASSTAAVSAVSSAPAAPRDGDPLAPLRAMSDEEKIALFE